MAELLTTKEILVALENIIKKAEKYLCIFTFNIKIDQNYLTRLRNASKRGINITVVFGVDNGDHTIINALLEMPNCTVYFKEYLHAKFYYNEKELLVGSMNLSEASAVKNFELGVYFTGEEYQKIIKKVKEEAKEIIEDSKKFNPIINEQPKSSFSRRTFTPIINNHKTDSKKHKGACIRCHQEIKYNPEKPFCSDCFFEWAEWENEYYIENFCHCCGQKNDSISFAKPECYSCYNNFSPPNL